MLCTYTAAAAPASRRVSCTWYCFVLLLLPGNGNEYRVSQQQCPKKGDVATDFRREILELLHSDIPLRANTSSAVHQNIRVSTPNSTRGQTTATYRTYVRMIMIPLARISVCPVRPLYRYVQFALAFCRGKISRCVWSLVRWSSCAVGLRLRS